MRRRDLILQSSSACLRTTAWFMTIVEVLQKLQNLGNTRLMKFVGSGQAAAFTSVKCFVMSMKSGRCPKFPVGEESGFVKEVKHRLPLLVV